MLKNLFAGFIILGAITSLGFKFAMNGLALEVGGPGVLHSTPTGELTVQVGQELWLLDKNNLHRGTIDFRINIKT